MPISSQKLDFAMLVSLRSGEPLTAIDVNPWFKDPLKSGDDAPESEETPSGPG